MTPIDPQSMPWEWVKQGLEEVIRRTKPYWTVADVYNALHNKQAFLYQLNPDAFVIVQRLQDYNGPYLFVWIIHGKNVLNAQRHQVMAELRKLAVACGCKRMEMRSPRRWDAADLGWRTKETVYEAEVWPEEAL